MLKVSRMKGVLRIISTIAISALAMAGMVFSYMDLRTSYYGFALWSTESLNWPQGDSVLMRMAITIIITVIQMGYVASFISGEQLENDYIKSVIQITDQPIYKLVALCAFLIDLFFDVWQLKPTPVTIGGILQTFVMVITLYTFFSEVAMTFFLPYAIELWRLMLGDFVAWAKDALTLDFNDGGKKQKMSVAQTYGVDRNTRKKQAENSSQQKGRANQQGSSQPGWRANQQGSNAPYDARDTTRVNY